MLKAAIGRQNSMLFHAMLPRIKNIHSSMEGISNFRSTRFGGATFSFQNNNWNEYEIIIS